MTNATSGLLSELVLVRMHQRAADYLLAKDTERPAVIAACRDEGTVSDLPERILSRTIYAQSASFAAPLRELIQNALDASPRGARIDVYTTRSSARGARSEVQTVTVVDRGRGMSRLELLEDLLVPFRSGKEGEPDTIGEHGIGFLSALSIAPRIEIVSVTHAEAHRLRIEPLGRATPHPDFLFTLTPIERPSCPDTGTTVCLTLEPAIDPQATLRELESMVGLVDPARARIFVDGTRINVARARLRRVARAPIGEHGELELFIGRGDGILPQLSLIQQGLLVNQRFEPFGGAELSLHREFARAVGASGYGLVVELPLPLPLNKSRSAVASCVSAEVERATAFAFERFVLEDALYDREMLCGVDHRLSSVLDRLLNAALLGEPAEPNGALDPLGGSSPPKSALATENEPHASAGYVDPAGTGDAAAPKTPTVAAPERVVRFADALLDRPMFPISTFTREPSGALVEARELCPLRALIQAYSSGRLREKGMEQRPGVLYLSLDDPPSQALFRRLNAWSTTPIDRAREAKLMPMARISRERLLEATALPGVRALAAAVSVLERIDAAIATAAGLAPSPIYVHQDLYGPDEMAHTDGSGISINLASPRVRALLCAVLEADDPIAFFALVDLFLHEKAHVSLASHIPRSTAEHGASFYRRKDVLRRLLLKGIETGKILDPMSFLDGLRRGLSNVTLPSPDALARVFSAERLAA